MFRLNTNIDKKERSVVSMRDFKGLDTVHSPMNISYQHAIDMRNLINRNGVNRKRKGWRQEHAFDKTATPAGTWSGKLDFSEDQDGSDLRNVLIHFYFSETDGLVAKAFDLDNGRTPITATIKSAEGEVFTQSDLHFAFMENKLIVVGAGPVLCMVVESGTLSFYTYRQANADNTLNLLYNQEETLTSVSQIVEDNYTPFTNETFVDQYITRIYQTQNYPAPDADNEYGEIYLNSTDYDVPNAGSRGDKKENILCDRLTSIISVDITDEMRQNVSTKEYTNIYYLNNMEAYNTLQQSNSGGGGVVMAASINSASEYYQQRSAYYNDVEIEFVYNYQKPILEEGQSEYLKPWFNETEINLGPGELVIDKTAFTSKLNSFVFFMFGKYLFINLNSIMNVYAAQYSDPLQNITVRITYKRRMLGNRQELIDRFLQSEMVTVFGAEGNANRAFYSDGSNTILYSEYRNPLYIGSQNTIVLGSTPITGWIKGTETSLYVFKQYSRQEESLYVIDGELVTSEENQYGVDEGEVVFRNKGYALPESAVNQDAVCSLANDVLVVSDDGVYGITLSANVASTERFARSRAEQIKNLLQEQDLTKAKCIVWDNKMFLAVGSLVFVADARFRATFDGDMADTFNYEWWLWDNIPVKYWVVIQDKLCFVTDDNRLCAFYDGFSDYVYDDLLVAVIDGSNVTISNSYAEYNKIALNAAYRLCVDSADITDIVDDALVINTERLYTVINEGDTVYFDVTAGALTGYPVTSGTPYTVESIDIMSGQVKFSTTDGTAVAFAAAMAMLLASNPLRISKAANNEYDMKIDTSVAAGNTQITDADGNVVKLVEYNGVSSYSATIFKKYPVKAYWQTGSYDFGSSMYSKTMERFSVAFDRESPKKLKLYYTTAWNGGDRLFKDLKKNADFDFDAFSFLFFTFDKRFETSYTRRLLIRNFNYIAFRLLSDDAEDFSVDSMSFVYKVNKLNRGEH